MTDADLAASPPASGLVEIAREFLLAYRRTTEIAALHRSGDLVFEDVRGWVGDDESSALFRLKELCHGLFRDDDALRSGPMEREALFDLTVGALFHEAMRFRENLYQREVYGPRVGKLPGESPAEKELIREFKRIVSGASVRLDEALQETEALLEQTRRQFHGLLLAYRDEGLLARFLVENAGYVVLAFEGGVEAIFEETHGDAAEGWGLAARSYLDSGYFPEAARTFEEARRRGGDREAWVRGGRYAEAMAAYMRGDYPTAVERLGEWIEGERRPEEAAWATLALDAVSHLGRLSAGPERERVSAAADRLAERLRSFAAA